MPSMKDNCFSNLPKLSLFAISALSVAPDVHAYLDPGTGSMLLSAFIGVTSSLYFAVKKLPSVWRRLVFRVKGNQELLKATSVVLYAESAAYWSTFKPLLDEFLSRHTQVLYLTSNPNDPAFSSNYSDNIRIKYIGTGNTAYTALGFIEADVAVFTTPGLDVLQIRRSKGVKRYIHVLHSLTDVHLHKLFAFDWYDEVICASSYQAKSIRAIEKTRGMPGKKLPVLGCLYIDTLMARVQSASVESKENTVVLLAPT